MFPFHITSLFHRVSLRIFILSDYCVSENILQIYQRRNRYNPNLLSCITGSLNYSLPSVCACVPAALKYSAALCQQKCKRRGTLESNYCSSNFGKNISAFCNLFKAHNIQSDMCSSLAFAAHSLN